MGAAAPKQSVVASCSSSHGSASCSSTSTCASSLGYSHSQSPASASGSKQERNILLEDEYQEEAIAHMKQMETQTMASVELMDVQPELRWFMRPYLVDFLIEIHQTFRLRPETLFLTMNIVDRYVSKRIVYKRHYQLVGCAALLIAAKFEDSKDRVPTVSDLSQMCCNAYDESAFTQMEGHVLSTIGWALGHPTAEAWLRLESVTAHETASVVNVARFLLEASLFQRDFITLTSSALARGALIVARGICGSKHGHAEPLTEAAQMLDTYVSENLDDLSLILVKKHSHAHFTNASGIVADWYRARHSHSAAPATAALLPAHAPRSSCTYANDSEDDESMVSTPLSTPSRSMDEDEDEDDLPVTPLSIHDPLPSSLDKENRTHHHTPAKCLPPVSVSRPALGSTTSWNVQL